MPVEIRTDPVCRMEVEPRQSAGKFRFGEWVYYFCSPRCEEDSDRDPVKYLLKK